VAAPKRWGYTRDQAVQDEILASWADGDLTAIVAKELEERLLANAEDRSLAASFARDAERSRDASGQRDALLSPRPGVLERCRALADEPEISADFGASAVIARPGIGTLLGGAVGLGLALAVIGWMLQNFR